MPDLEKLIADLLAQVDENARITRNEEVNRELNIASWKWDENPDPVEA